MCRASSIVNIVNIGFLFLKNLRGIISKIKKYVEYFRIFLKKEYFKIVLLC